MFLGDLLPFLRLGRAFHLEAQAYVKQIKIVPIVC